MYMYLYIHIWFLDHTHRGSGLNFGYVLSNHSLNIEIIWDTGDLT